MKRPVCVGGGLLLSAVVLISVIGISVIGCSRQEVRSLSREDLFRIELGKMEDQLDVFYGPGQPLRHKTRLFMRDGRFFVGDAAANKIMQFTSYGDLLSLLYNPDDNPRPVQLQASQNPGTLINRRAYPYHFRQTGEIAVTSGKELLVEEYLSPERAVYDEERAASLNRQVLRFTPQGRLIDYLGQEGIGGSPFPHIESIHVNDHDEIIVISHTLDTWIVYWFSPEGEPLYEIEIPNDRLPLVADEDNLIPFLETIKPDREQHRLYLHLNYYRESVDAETEATYGIETYASRIYWLDLESGRYEGYVDIPENVQQRPGHSVFDQQEVQFLYEFIGTGRGETFFLLSRERATQVQLMIMNAEGRVLSRRMIEIPEPDLLMKSFNLTADGILSALLVGHDEARVVWWRSDRLLAGR